MDPRARIEAFLADYAAAHAARQDGGQGLAVKGARSACGMLGTYRPSSLP